MLNACDIFIIIVLLIAMAAGLKRGLVRSVFNLCKTIAAIVLAGQAYPYITRFLRQSGGIFDIINNAIKTWLVQNINPNNIIGAPPVSDMIDSSLKSQIDFINGLSLPGFLKDSLVSSNNAAVYEAMNVDGVYDYISSFLSNICVNIISWALAFAVIFLLLGLLAGVLDLIAKLPVISMFNRIGGLVVGFLQATIFIWICHVIIVLFFSSPQYAMLIDMLDKSMFAGLFFEYNILLELVNRFVF